MSILRVFLDPGFPEYLLTGILILKIGHLSSFPTVLTRGWTLVIEEGQNDGPVSPVNAVINVQMGRPVQGHICS